MRKDRQKKPKTPEKPRLERRIVLAVLLLILVGLAIWYLDTKLRRHANVIQEATATYVGQARCAECHAQQAKAWRGSHHAQAMQVATDATVLGGFNNTHFSNQSVNATFTKKDGKFYVNTTGPDGKPTNFDFTYTFGVYPLQQYLVPFPGGRLQSFVVAWDSRTQNGQRWFDLYPDQKIAPGDPLHWTGRNQTWNYMCAECHSTDLRKNYDLATDSYSTKWSEINVSCETCHGPGSNHVAWAKSHKNDSYKSDQVSNGLVINLTRTSGAWAGSAQDSGTMHWKGQPRSHTEVETCAPCHSRRHQITSDPQPGHPFLDSYVPSLLEAGVYFADGQVLEEDYEWGSFIQSKMYGEGVNCSDCHDPHTGKLPSTNLNAVCGKCHSLTKFGNEQHHHHKADGAGALCVNCHMPPRTYMVVDERRDHSLRIPRPDFSVAYGTPNACNQCHKEKSNQWATDTVAKWYGPSRRQETHFVTALDAGRRGLPSAETQLTALISDAGKPGIARATALSLLSPYLTARAFPVVEGALRDSDALVRTEAVKALEPLPTADRVRLAAPMLTDPVRSVRIEAARLLAGTPPDTLQEAQKTALNRAIEELIASEMAAAERPENHVNLALLYAQMGRTADAETQLQTALRLDPKFVPAMVNLADLYRAQQRDDEGQKWLEKAIAVAPNAAEPMYALGLLKVRQKQYAEALVLLGKAASLQPSDVRYSYVYAVALNSAGQPEQAIRILEDAHRRRPADREVLLGLISFERAKGDLSAATTYAKQLVELAPDDPNARAMLAQLQGQ